MIKNDKINSNYLKYNNLLKELIKFNTSNPPGNEYECINFIKKYLENEGFNCKLYSKDPNRPNLVTTLKGKSSYNSLLFYGHVDVVKADSKNWKYPPFEGIEEEGYIWGRGTLDMKGSIAMMIAALIETKKQNIIPEHDILIVILSDEEAGSEFGAEFIVNNYPELFKEVKYAIGEFGGIPLYLGKNKFYQIQISEKKLCWLKIKLSGTSGHASFTERNGIMYKLSKLLLKINKLRLAVFITEPAKIMIKTIADNMSFPAGFFIKLLLIPFLTKFILFIFKKKFNAFEPLLFNTVNVTKIITSNEINVIPDQIEIQLDCRLLPGQSSVDFINLLKSKIDKNLNIEIIKIDDKSYELDFGLYRLLADIIKKIDPSGIPLPLLLTGCSDARSFSKLGIQCYGFTPMNFNESCNALKLLHSVDERIPITALPFGIEALLNVIKKYK